MLEWGKFCVTGLGKEKAELSGACWGPTYRIQPQKQLTFGPSGAHRQVLRSG